MMVYRLAPLVLSLLAAGCAHPVKPLEVVPTRAEVTCPAALPQPSFPASAEPAGDLLAGLPSPALLCRYDPAPGNKRWLTPAQVAQVRAPLNALPLAPRGARPCPYDNGSGYALVLEHTLIAVHAQGCQLVSDGRHLRDGGPALLDLLATLTAG